MLKILLAALILTGTKAIFAQDKPAASDILEIALKTGDGFCFDCERVTTLRAGGERAKFHGGRKSRLRRGDFYGEMTAANFVRLARTFIENGFFDLDPRYEGRTSDVASVEIMVVYAGGSKTVVNFKRSDESRLKKIERAFDDAADKIVWCAANEN